MVNDPVDPKLRSDVPQRELVSEIARKSKKTCVYIDVICIVGFIICLGVSIFVVVNVPIDTGIIYYGKHIPIPFALALPVVGLFLFWATERVFSENRPREKARKLRYISGPATIFVLISFQVMLAITILREAGNFT